MSSFLKKKPVVVALVITAIVLIITIVSHFIGFNPVTGITRTILSPLRHGAAFIGDRAYSVIEFLWEMDSYKEENERLTKEVIKLQKTNRDTANYREENERLKTLLELKDEVNKDYSTVTASVIGYSKNNWYDKIEISKGTLSGVATGNTVIANDGVVGIVSEVGLNWALVTTIIDKENAMGVKITRTADAAVLEGDEELMMQGKCKMTFINSSANIIAGDLIETSGSAGIYPAGLSVGTVESIVSDSMGELKYAKIKTAVDLKGLHEVLIINGVR